MTTTVQVSADHLFRLAEAAGTQDGSAAELAYEILINDVSQEVRLKARFQLARLEKRQGHFQRAAELLKQVLEHRPEAVRVRSELADVLSKIE